MNSIGVQLNDIVDNIYVISLKRCIDRREHIKKLFKKHEIKYTLFDAVDKTDTCVNDMYQSSVFLYPPCFRCKKDNCSHENNVLIPAQVANFMSYLKLFNTILKTDDEIVLICEDDIQFTEHAETIFNKLNIQFIENTINIKEPFIIGLGATLSKYHECNVNTKVRLDKRYTRCNPSFIINKLMIQKLINEFNIIDTTSDVFIHEQIGKKYQYILTPLPIYELSYTKEIAIFVSEIHPKGINEEDIERMKQHVQRIN
jgi:GR25 family glycosyltransferase involved in LPS biosynthesis